jgi:hypothetical protein
MGEYGALIGQEWVGETEAFREKHVPLLLISLQIPC